MITRRYVDWVSGFEAEGYKYGWYVLVDREDEHTSTVGEIEFGPFSTRRNAIDMLHRVTPVAGIVVAVGLKTLCAWCGVTIKDGIEPVSHGICGECEKNMTDEAET